MIKNTKIYAEFYYYPECYYLPAHVRTVFYRQILRISLPKRPIGKPNRMH